MSPINTPLVESKLTEIIRFTGELEGATAASFEEYATDSRNTRTAERTIELLVEFATDVIGHILLSHNMPPPASYRDAFVRAGEDHIVSSDLAISLASIASIRNRLLHAYDTAFDPRKAYETFRSAPPLFRAFAREVATHIGTVR